MKFFLNGFIIAGLILASFFPAVNLNALTSQDAFKAIVKIYTIFENSDYSLEISQSGSGVIISSDGVILTNSHVISVEDSFSEEAPAAYKVCLSLNIAEEPDCKYSADLIAKDGDKDIALLKIRNISGLSNKSGFDFINRAGEDNFLSGDAVTALGYPSFGGDTITQTSGVISGTIEKNSISWIKTDTALSFGSSGGALVDESGILLGVVSQAARSLLGSMGYVINITSINSWIDQNKDRAGQVSSLQSRADNFIKKQNSLKSENIFTNQIPDLSLTKPVDWEFEYGSENEISISDPEEDQGISFTWLNMGILMEGRMDVVVNDFRNAPLYISDEEIKISDIDSKKIIVDFLFSELAFIYVPVNNYVLLIVYPIVEDLSPDKINSVLESVKITKNNNFQAIRNYQNNNPYFTLSVGSDWVINEKNSQANPVEVYTYNNQYAEISFEINKLSSSLQKMSKTDYLKYVKTNDSNISDIESFFNMEKELVLESATYKINNELNGELFYKYKFNNKETDETMIYLAVYRIIDNDKELIITLNYGEANEKNFNSVLKSFESEVLANLSFGREIEKDIIEIIEEMEIIPDPIPTIQPKLNLEVKNLNQNSQKLLDKILLEVEKNGEAWYLSPSNNKAYFLGRPDDAFGVMRGQGIGITDANLGQIPIGLSNLSGLDTDGDGLPDLLEDAIGTDKNKLDTDGDGYDDKTEIEAGYDPKRGGGAKLNINNIFVEKQKGKIFLAVERNGEAWYANPADGKRYFLGRPTDAFNVMRNLGLGISNKDFESLSGE